MTIVFFDKDKETYSRIEKVWYVTDAYGQLEKRGCRYKLWRVTLEDGTQRDIPQRRFSIHRIDATA